MSPAPLLINLSLLYQMPSVWFEELEEREDKHLWMCYNNNFSGNCMPCQCRQLGSLAWTFWRTWFLLKRVLILIFFDCDTLPVKYSQWPTLPWDSVWLVCMFRSIASKLHVPFRWHQIFQGCRTVVEHCWVTSCKLGCGKITAPSLELSVLY